MWERGWERERRVGVRESASKKEKESESEGLGERMRRKEDLPLSGSGLED